MTLRQRENAARYLYDASKILFAAAVVGNLVAWEQFNVLSFSLGAVAMVLCFWWGYYLDGAS